MKTVELDELQPHLEAAQNYESVARDALEGRPQTRSIEEEDQRQFMVSPGSLPALPHLKQPFHGHALEEALILSRRW